MNGYEYEIKLLGSRQGLEEVLSRIVAASKQANPPKQYRFETVYYDTPEKDFTRAGYSIRHRPKQGSYDESIEIKQIAGQENGVSKRLEIGVRRNAGLMSLYFSLLAHEGFPTDIPSIPAFERLKPQYATIVDRVEQEMIVRIGEDAYLLETAMDRIDFIAGDVVLAEQEELEIELKSDGDTALLMEWFRYETQGCDVQFTVDSKAKRLQNLLERDLK